MPKLPALQITCGHLPAPKRPEGSDPPKDRYLMPIKLPSDPPFAGASFPRAQLIYPPPLLFRYLLIPLRG